MDAASAIPRNRIVYRIFKRTFDIGMSLALLPLMVLCALVLLILNPWMNRGPLFFRQERMGRNCEPFHVVKFRSMTCAHVVERGPDDPLETSRITKLGRFLRRSRIDELPQILNVMSGEMSLIGPRPDFLSHARAYLVSVPGYRQRHAVRPGISGLAQTRLGYVEGTDQTRSKVDADLEYIRTASFLTDTRILIDTLRTVLGGFGR
ncbi:sugar transferase [Roseobacter sp. HKCCA0434]|uniref:sugar transferase n=1 Tax=Roseobacter sp. HKCCA0434 TaxID=3079297 RepID=UPI002905E695|nr:sugar transferase [Roseobacter sp. HKCCA0434]